MPATYRLDLVERVVWSRAWGLLRDEELAAHSRKLVTDPRFSPDFRQVQDLLDVEEARLTPSGLREVARLNPFGPGARRAVVVPTSVLFGLARMHEHFREGGGDELQVFRAMAPALAWLGLPPAWPPPAAAPDDPLFQWKEAPPLSM